MNKKTIIILSAIVLVIILFWFLVQGHSSASYRIKILTTNPETVISVADNKASSFTDIGTGSVEYSTAVDGPIFIRAVLGNNQSIATVDSSTGENQEIFINLMDTIDKDPAYNKPIITPYWEKDVVHGVDERSHTLTSTADDRFVIPEISFISIPYLKSVVWNNIDNYAYNVFSGGAGMVVRGLNAGTEYFEDAILRVSDSGTPREVVKNINSPLVLLSSESIFLSPGFDSTLKKLADIPLCDNYFFDADENLVYFARLPAVDEYATEDSEVVPESADLGAGSTLYVFEYSGKTLFETNLPEAHSLIGVTPYKEGYVVATDHGLIFMDSSGNVNSELDLHITPKDIIQDNDSVYIFSDLGVWLLDDTSDTVLLYQDIGLDSYVVGSLHQSISGNKDLLFTTVNRNLYSGSVYSFNP